MADTGDSKSLAGNRVGVRIPSPASTKLTKTRKIQASPTSNKLVGLTSLPSPSCFLAPASCFLPLAPSCFLAPASCFLLPGSCFLLPASCSLLLPGSCFLLPASCSLLLPASCFLPPTDSAAAGRR